MCIRPPDVVVQNIALLCWITEETAKEKFSMLQERSNKELFDSKQRDIWRKHPLYRNTVEILKGNINQVTLSLESFLGIERFYRLINILIRLIRYVLLICYFDFVLSSTLFKSTWLDQECLWLRVLEIVLIITFKKSFSFLDQRYV